MTPHQLGNGRASASRAIALAALVAWAAASPAGAQTPCAPVTPDGMVVADDTISGDEFGYSVSISGRTAVVGAWVDETPAGETGTATVFVRQGGAWLQEQQLLPMDAAADDQFGYSVSIDRDTILVGSKLDDDAGLNSGSAHVFVRAAGVWTHQAKLTSADAEAGDSFGHAVALRGDVAVVGAPRDDDGGSSSGAVYIFRRVGTAWMEEQKLTPRRHEAGDEFGYSVALASTDVVAVGSRNASPAALGAGAAHVFVRSRGRWLEQAELVADDAADDDEFGWSIGADGSVIAVGAHQAAGVTADSGAAYVFERVGTGWAQQARLEAADVISDDRFGSSVSVSQGRVMVGAPFHEHPTPEAQSAAWFFTRPGLAWQEEAELLPSSGVSGTWFGWSVAIDGNVAIGGARFDPSAGSRAGNADLYGCGELDCDDGVDDDADGDLDCVDSDCRGVAPCLLELCANGADDDGDGSIDCADSDCLGAPPCLAEACANGIDDDGDGDVDCEDADCMGSPACGVEDCRNGFDDDFDFLSDCDDSDCVTDPACLAEDCVNGVDDDGDGAVDCDDADCVADPACLAEDCVNGIDDDGDGAVDCDDPDCVADPACLAEDCVNGVDDDGDGAVDCDDADCVADPACLAEDCVNGVDDDDDGAVDCDDADCVADPACLAEDCVNGVDDDGDGAVDCDDSDCVADPACLAEDCSNGVDDDGDGDVDCDDSDCPCDMDGDGVTDALDCAPMDPGSFARPVETPWLRVDRQGLPAGAARLTWADDRASTGLDTSFEVASELLSVLRVSRMADAPCQASVVDSSYEDAAPLSNDGRYYLVRAVNACGPSAGEEWGRSSSGQSRPACP